MDAKENFLADARVPRNINCCSRRDLLRAAMAAGAGMMLPTPLLAQLLEGGINLNSATTAIEGDKADSKPNFVFIFVDDMGWADLGCYGSTFYDTPNIDKLAARGMKFTDAYAAAPVCSPTRACLMTGKYPARLPLTAHVGNHKPTPEQKLAGPTFVKRLAESEVVIANALKAAGYKSACIGKWDLGNKPYFPEDHGFDYTFGAMGGGMVRTHFYPWSWPGKVEGKEGEYLADRLTNEALGFMEANNDQPFFVYLSHYAVHLPLEAKEQVVEKYRPRIKPGQAQNNPVYAAMVESIDDCVGRVVKKLEDLGLSDRTVIILTSDNGGLHIEEKGYAPATSNAPLREGKGHLYEGGIREPLIICWPRVVPEGSECSVPVSTQDFYPTMLDLAGVERKGQIVDGESLAPLMKREGELKRDAIYWHYRHYSPQGGEPSSAIRQKDYKLIKFYEDNHVELYNLKDDIGEMNDLSANMPEKTAKMRKKLDDWLKSVKAQMPTPNPDYSP